MGNIRVNFEISTAFYSWLRKTNGRNAIRHACCLLHEEPNNSRLC